MVTLIWKIGQIAELQMYASKYLAKIAKYLLYLRKSLRTKPLQCILMRLKIFQMLFKHFGKGAETSRKVMLDDHGTQTQYDLPRIRYAGQSTHETESM